MNEYGFLVIYFDLKTEKQTSKRVTMQANTKWGAWTKTLYAAMEKETENYILVEIDLISDQGGDI